MQLSLQIMDEKSLIKKYQNEICQLKEELDQLKRGILSGTPSKDAIEDNVILWKQKVTGLSCIVFLHSFRFHFISSF
jgi:hypothetical protein